jgi:hypothetical protein
MTHNVGLVYVQGGDRLASRRVPEEGVGVTALAGAKSRGDEMSAWGLGSSLGCLITADKDQARVENPHEVGMHTNSHSH